MLGKYCATELSTTVELAHLQSAGNHRRGHRRGAAVGEAAVVDEARRAGR